MKDQKSTENIGNKNNDVNDMSFETALYELEQIVKKIDSGIENLESSVSSYERASLLKKHCEAKLEQAKFKIEEISKSDGGAIKIQEIKNYSE